MGASRLLIDLLPGQRISLQGAVDAATVELVHKSGRVARLKVMAPESVRITRSPAPAGRDDQAQADCASRTEHG